MFAFGSVSKARRDSLHPDLQRVLDRAMSWQIVDFSITQGKRTMAEQTALYAQGRQSVDVVNRLRKSAGWGPITEKEAKKIVTWTMDSNHLTGKAVDVAVYPYDPSDEERAWMLQGILLSAAAAEGIKVRSGTDFNRDKNFRNDRTVDVPHLELDY